MWKPKTKFDLSRITQKWNGEASTWAHILLSLANAPCPLVYICFLPCAKHSSPILKPAPQCNKHSALFNLSQLWGIYQSDFWDTNLRQDGSTISVRKSISKTAWEWTHANTQRSMFKCKQISLKEEEHELHVEKSPSRKSLWNLLDDLCKNIWLNVSNISQKRS